MWSQLIHFLFLWIDPLIFLDWKKNTLLFVCSTNILLRLLTVNMKNCLTQKNSKMCDPIVVTLLKMRPPPPPPQAFCLSTYYTYPAIYLIRGMFSREDCRKNREGQELLSRENETSLDSGPYKKYLDAPLIHMPRFSSLQWVEH